MPLTMLGLTMLVLGSVLAACGAPADAAGALGCRHRDHQKEAADSQERIDTVADETHVPPM